MIFIVAILSILAFIKTLGYAIYEYKDNSNKVVSIIVGFFSVITLIGPIVIAVIR